VTADQTTSGVAGAGRGVAGEQSGGAAAGSANSFSSPPFRFFTTRPRRT